MHLYPVKRVSALRRLLPPAAVAALAALLFYGLGCVSRTSEQEQKATLERAIQKSLTSCYAVEGAYPASLAYLEEHYGLMIDHEKYEVDYQTIGTNIRPSVLVVRLGESPDEGGQDGI
ncbi:MAG: hypothetical protein HFE86_01785 [Clostridiales bacterium]|nr:hypothetical protein [Clostridiales bacterium]